MNNKAFTIIELLSTIIIISIIMTLVLPSALRVSKKNKTRIYTEYENMMVEYAKINTLNSEDVIDLMDLEELDKVKRECIGYVTIDHESEPNEYKAYISCGDDYETEGFNQEFKASKGIGEKNNDNMLMPSIKLRIMKDMGFYSNNQQIQEYINSLDVDGAEVNTVSGILENLIFEMIVSPLSYYNEAAIPYEYTGDGEVWCSLSASEEYGNCKVYPNILGLVIKKQLPKNTTVCVGAEAGQEYSGIYRNCFAIKTLKGESHLRVISVSELMIEGGKGKVVFGVTGPIDAPLTVSNNKCSTRITSSTTFETTYEVICSNLPRGSNTITFQTPETEYFLAGSVSKTVDFPYEEGYVRIVYPENVRNMSASCDTTTSYTVNHHGGTLTCTTSNSSIATCSVSGNNTINITGVSSGSVDITVKSAATDRYTEATVTDYIDDVSCKSWHYNGSTILGCSSLCNSGCKELNSSSIWSCNNSDTTPPTSYNATSGSHCWCYH